MKGTATAIALLAGATTTAALAEGDKLIVLDWAGYEDRSFIPAYIDQHGSAPSHSFFSDEEEAFQKLRAGFEADAAHPRAVSVAKWREAGVIEPLDTSRLENWDDLNPLVREAFKFDDGNYLMPADWGATALPIAPTKWTSQRPARSRSSLIRNPPAATLCRTIWMTSMRLAFLQRV